MTREQKLALVLGFAAILVVGLLVSDHMAATRAQGLDAAPHDATVMVDAGQAQAMRRMVTLPSGPDHFRGRPIRQDPEATTPMEEPAPLEATLAKQPQDEAHEPVRFVLGQGGGVLTPGQGRNESVLERLGDGVANGAERLARGIRDLAGSASAMSSPGLAQLDGASRGEPVGRSVPVKPVEVTHHVKAGESLYKIAQQYFGDGNRWRQIAGDNPGRVGDNGSVREGVALRILNPRTGIVSAGEAVKPAPMPAPAPTPVREASKPRPESAQTYTVRAGDTLGEISQRLLGTVRRQHELIALNRDVLTDPDHLRAGMVLKLPSS
ncbi:MAG: LysM peptidoglycan-binding domain-containing protein [Phycisphaeraceae bacterium]|nr:LysM peptidoglycan-binding domain-containing protein [Phycisphaeraceae bacterium]